MTGFSAVTRIGIAIERLREPRLVHLEAGDRAVGQRAPGVAEQADAFEQVVRDHRQHHVQLEVAGLAGDRDRGVVADDLRRDHGRRLRESPD